MWTQNYKTCLGICVFFIILLHNNTQVAQILATLGLSVSLLTTEII